MSLNLEIFMWFQQNMSIILKLDEKLLNWVIYKLSGQSCIFFTSESKHNDQLMLNYMRLIIYWMYIQTAVNYTVSLYNIINNYLI